MLRICRLAMNNFCSYTLFYIVACKIYLILQNINTPYGYQLFLQSAVYQQHIQCNKHVWTCDAHILHHFMKYAEFFTGFTSWTFYHKLLMIQFSRFSLTTGGEVTIKVIWLKIQGIILLLLQVVITTQLMSRDPCFKT